MDIFSIFGNSAEKGIATNRPKAAEEHKITIEFHSQDTIVTNTKSYATVIGYMTNEFTYSSTGNYKNIWEMNFPDNILTRAISDETQRNLFNYGYTTKKMYSNGESPTITVEFICYAGDDEGAVGIYDGKGSFVDPLAISEILVNATLPKVSNGNMMLATNLGNLVNETAPLAIVDAGMKLYDGAKNITSGASVDWASINAAIDKVSSQKPPVCKLKIGNIFEKDMMVVKRVEVSLSKEYLSQGVPLYGKYNVTFESLFNAANVIEDQASAANDKVSIFGTGLKTKQEYKGRVNFT